jgi:tetratricopeptide (TPR) repeat protein
MASQESRELFEQAVQIIYEEGREVSANKLRDAISLLLVAVKKAGGPFPNANAMLAESYLMMRDYDSALRYANVALSQNPRLLEAQYIKVTVAQENLGSLIGGLVGTLSKMSKQQKLNNELVRYVSIYDELCAEGMPADEFVYRSKALISVADALNDIGNPAVKKVNIYGHVANARIDNLSYESEEEREAVKTVQRLAEGRMSL